VLLEPAYSAAGRARHRAVDRSENNEAMQAVLRGRHPRAVLPTGSGKSAIYQVPSPLTEGCGLEKNALQKPSRPSCLGSLCQFLATLTRKSR
jgi:hypothetical protein